MQSSNIPVKFLVPFAQNDSAKVEIPVTTSDSTRASQSLGFPPLTMQPPEAGGVPPQGEDFNGALNQVARIAWWMMMGGGFPYDSTFASASQIGGYPKGAFIPSSDLTNFWLNTIDANTTDPDGSSPAGWIKPFAALAGSPAQRFSAAAAVAATDVVQLQQAQAMRGQLRGVFGFNASQTLTATHAGGYILFYGSTVSQTITLPAWSSISAGDEFFFYNGASVPVTIAPPSGATGITAKIVQPGESYDVAADAVANSFVVKGGTTTLQSIATMPAPLGGTARMSSSAALGATQATFTDDFVHVSSSLGLPGHKIANFSATLDLTKASVIGGMIGSAPTAGQFVAVYAAFNPATGAYGVVGKAVAPTSAPASVYAGTPVAGYTETALIGVVPAHQSTAGQFDHFTAKAKIVARGAVTVLNVSASVSSLTSQTTNTAVPANAVKMLGNLFATSSSTSASSNVLQIAADTTGLDARIAANGTTTIQTPYDLIIAAANTFAYSNSSSVGTPQSQITCTGYEWA